VGIGGRGFVARFVDVAHRERSRPAIVEGDRTVDYATLESRSRDIAAHVVAATRGRPGFAVLLFERRIPAVESIVGALRAGRPYVPLDARDPDERLRFIAQDCAPAILLTERTLVERARSLVPGCPVVDVDTVTTNADIDPGIGAGDDDLAYLIYTSGSTGQPKGVRQTLGHVLFFTDAYAKALAIGPDDRISLAFALSFSASLGHLYAGLAHGATLCAYDMRVDGVSRFADWLERERVTVLATVPTVFRELVARLAPEQQLAQLRAIMLTGEAAFASDAGRFRRHTRDDCILVNQLGATENDCIAQYVIRHAGPLPSTPILPVGRCPEGVSVRIERDDGSAAAVDEIGSIVVMGTNVSPGYWKRPDLDAASFAVDPADPRIRLYRGGDQGRIDADGNLHFIGRRGSRIKLNGISIDLMEVEAALTACPGVVRAVVVATSRASSPEADGLRACLVQREGDGIDPVAVRQWLAERLPVYMVPNDFRILDELPLTATGKIDRLAVQALPPQPAPPTAAIAPTGDELERRIADIFQRLLECRPVGPRDDFFLLGGDSMLVAELQNRLRDAFGTDVPDFHRHSTVASVAAAIRGHRSAVPAAGARSPLLVPLRETGSRPPLFLVHGRLGQALVSPHFLALLGDDQPVWTFRARGLDGRKPHESIEAMAADYADEIRRVRQHGPYFIGALCIGAFVAIDIARILRAAGETVLPLLLLDPPERAFTVHEANVTDSAILSRLRERETEVGSTATLDNPAYANASIRVARALEDAIGRYRTRPYDGPVCMLVSSDRLARAPRTQWRKIYAGEITQHVVADRHTDVLDARTSRFAEALGKALRRVFAATPASP
jgi:amino acid adenylation domain-containing protein